LLAFSRRQIVQPRVLDLNAVVAGRADTIRRTLGRGVTLIADLAPNLSRVRIDSSQAEEILTNLTANSRDAMPGGGTLTIATRNEIVGPCGIANRPDLPPGGYAVLAVTDTGVGMPPDVLARVFEPFFTAKEPGQGTGLGLAAVFGIATQAGGHAAAESRVGQGSTFRVYLPALPDDRPSNGGTGTTVLLAEDNAAVRGLASHLLQSLGFAVLEATTGDEALAVATGHPGRIDLLVTDVVMPGLPGPDLAHRLAAARPGLRVLFMSGYPDDAVFRHGILEPGSEFLQKPFTQIGFVQKVREVLSQPARP
jgi:two-component system, cell cycle sensor histidine kinase and response regulator CckA